MGQISGRCLLDAAQFTANAGDNDLHSEIQVQDRRRRGGYRARQRLPLAPVVIVGRELRAETQFFVVEGSEHDQNAVPV